MIGELGEITKNQFDELKKKHRFKLVETEYPSLTTKQFREKVRNCLRTFKRCKYKLEITDYYQNSLNMESEETYTGVLKDFKLIKRSPEDNWFKLKIEFKDGAKEEFEFCNDIVITQDIREKGNSFTIKWTTSGPYCYLTFKHI
jgi:hypothetical protein